MNKNKIISLIFLIFAILAIGVFAFLMVNKNDDEVDYKNISMIEYDFQDSSVPPLYHRSYVIKVSRDKLSIVVDSYGDVLTDEAFDFDEQKFQEVINLLEKYQIKKSDNKTEDDGCTGGTGEKITLYNEKSIIYSASVYHCQGDYGDLQGDTKSFAKDLKDLFSNFTNLLKEE